MTSPRAIDDVVPSVDDLSPADDRVDASVHAIFPSAHGLLLTIDAIDGREAAVLRNENGRLGRAHRADRYFTRNEAG